MRSRRLLQLENMKLADSLAQANRRIRELEDCTKIADLGNVTTLNITGCSIYMPEKLEPDLKYLEYKPK